MKCHNELTRSLYREFKDGDVQSTLSLISKKLNGESTTFIGSVGKNLGKMILKENFKESIFYDLWRISLTEEKDRFGVTKNFEVFCLLINTLGEILKKDCEKVKNFVKEILPTLNNWATVDILALRVIVNLAVQNQKEVFSLMERWIKSENKWIRRLAIATIPPYIRVKKTESKICLKLLNKVMKESDKDVKKAIGWALREVTKKDAKSVFEFLQKWAKIEDKNTKWIIKEGMKKLSKQKQGKLKSLIGA